jgi:hypothetical protein
LDSAKSIDHPTTRGDIRESAIRDSIEPFLPENLGVCSGFVTDVSGRITPQLDIILYRKEALSPFLLEGTSALVPFETLGLAIEVKSTLTTEHWRGQIQPQIDALSGMRDTAYIPPMNGEGAVMAPLQLRSPNLYVVAYKSDVAIDTLKRFIDSHSAVRGVTVISGDHRCHIVQGGEPDVSGTDLDRVLKFWSEIFFIGIAVNQLPRLSPEQTASLSLERERVRPKMPQEVFEQLMFTPSIAAYLSPPVPTETDYLQREFE